MAEGNFVELAKQYSNGLRERLNDRGLDDKEAAYVVGFMIDFDPLTAFELSHPGWVHIPGEPDALQRGREMMHRTSIQRAITQEMDYLGQHIVITKNSLIFAAWQIAIHPGAKFPDRIKAIELCARLSGALDAKSDKGGNGPVTVSVTVNDPTNVVFNAEQKREAMSGMKVISGN